MKKFWVGVVAFCVVGFVSVGGWILYQEVNLRNLQAQVEEYERISDKMHQDLEEALRKSDESLHGDIVVDDDRLTEEQRAEAEQSLEDIRQKALEELQQETTVTFDEIYQAYKDNPLRADDIYKNNRYKITAIINGMTNDGLFNLTGGATLTMQTQVDNVTVFFYTEFEKDQEENLKTVNVGDTITFEGRCLSAGSWVECKLIAN